MPRISNRLINQIQSDVESFAYTDTATYYTSAPAEGDQDAHGQPPKPSDGAGVSIECSYSDKPSKEVWADYADIQDIAGEIRIGEGVEPGKGDQFEIEGRWDELTRRAQLFETVDIRDRGDMGFLCLLKFETI